MSNDILIHKNDPEKWTTLDELIEKLVKAKALFPDDGRAYSGPTHVSVHKDEISVFRHHW